MGRSDRVDFRFDGKFDIPGVDRDASALAVHSETGNLWVITDDEVRLVEFTGRGKFVRAVELAGFKDTEGLCHVGGDRFLIAEEKKMRVTLVDVPPGSTKVEADERRFKIGKKSNENKGLEGVSYDAKTDTLYAVREDKPPAVFSVEPLLAGGDSMVEELALDVDDFDDLSDLFYDAATGWLWLLSDESKLAAAFDSQGERVTEMKLKKGRHGLPEDVEQAEGIARDRHGTLYICSEPNRIYRFVPR